MQSFAKPKEMRRRPSASIVQMVMDLPKYDKNGVGANYMCIPLSHWLSSHLKQLYAPRTIAAKGSRTTPVVLYL